MTTAPPPIRTNEVDETTNAVGILKGLLKQCKSDKRADRNKAWAAVQDPSLMTILAHAWGEDNDGQLVTLLTTIQTVPGCVSRARNLQRAIVALAKDVGRRGYDAMIDRLEADVTQAQTVADALGEHLPPTSVIEFNALSRLHIPIGYSIDSRGVYRVRVTIDGDVNKVRICSAPIFIGGRSVDVLTGEAKRQVIWRGPGGWCSRIVERRVLMDISKLISLSTYEAPISSSNLGKVGAYLDEFESENGPRFYSTMSTAHMGWQKNGGFLMPETFVTPETMQNHAPLILTPPKGLDTLSQGWVPEGTWEEWLGAVQRVRDYPYMYIALYASVAAPLLRVLNLPGFVIDFSGETSGGKSTALRFAASVWGRPSDEYPSAMYSWDATKVWIERLSGFLRHLPVILDETKRAKHPNIVRDVIYDFCQGQGRGRGSIEGTQKTVSWQSVLISSGEGAATKFTNDAGTKARVISLRGKPLGRDPKVGGQISEDVQMILADHYGHLGRRVLRFIVGTKQHHKAFQDLYKEARVRYSKGAKTGVARRHASYLAVLEVAAAIAHKVGVPIPNNDPFEHLVNCQKIAGLEADTGIEALQDIMTWAGVNQTKFFGRHESDGRGGDRVPYNGWVGKWVNTEHWDSISITTLVLREKITELGYTPDEIISRWWNRGWLRSSATDKRGTRRTATVRIDGESVRCYTITREAVAEVNS